MRRTSASSAAPSIVRSAEEDHEEAVISKDARVVEEIALRKTADPREETMRDTVRYTATLAGRGNSADGWRWEYWQDPDDP